MTLVNAARPVNRTETSKSQSNGKSFGQNLNTAMVTGGAAGFIADSYVNGSKHYPRKYSRQIDTIQQELPESKFKGVKEALQKSKENLEQVVKKQYNFWEKFGGQARNDAEAALKPLTDAKKDGLPKQVEKQVAKLSKVGKNAINNLDVLSKKGFGKAVLNGAVKQTKFAIIGTGVALAGLMGHQKFNSSKSEKA